MELPWKLKLPGQCEWQRRKTFQPNVLVGGYTGTLGGGPSKVPYALAGYNLCASPRKYDEELSYASISG